MTESAQPATPSTYLPLQRWLIACIVAVFLAVVVGGITRLTESGLSITEWKPVSGVLPPMTAVEWDAAFEAFQRIPQAETTHKDITLAGFKLIYWWEWFHRILARSVGLVFAIPFVVLLARGGIPERLHMRLTVLPLLTLGQGALGWYMVQSGLAERSSVSAYRLTAHLALALGILVIALWTLADLRPVANETRPSARWRWATGLVVALLFVTLLSGGFVAGLRAGRIYNTFPLMGETFVPPGYGQLTPWWRDAFEDPAAAQFHHRVLALGTAMLVLLLAVRARASVLGAAAARALRVMGAVVLAQVALGIATLLLAVPIALGVAHQFTGVLALSVGVIALYRVIEAPGSASR
jgi:heme a synthase